MSLTRLAVRIAAIETLRGVTLAEGRVYDSSTTPLDAAIKQQPLPFIVVTTDTDEREITGKDLSNGDAQLELVIEVAIASRVTVRVGDDQDEDQIVIPNTDEGLEITLDLIETQIVNALTHHRTPWANVFSALVPRMLRRLSRRGGSAEDGSRFAARQIVLTIAPIADPTVGQPIPMGGSWAKFFAAIDADPDLSHLSPLLRFHIAGDEVPTWEQISRLMGISAETVAALGVAPIVINDDGSAPIVTEIVVDDLEG